MFIVGLGVLLLVISLIVGYSKSFAGEINVYMNTFKGWRYTLGVSHKEYRGKMKESDDEIKIDVVTLGLVFVDIEVEFYKKVDNEV